MEGFRTALEELNILIKPCFRFQTQVLTTIHSWLMKLEIISKSTSILKMGQFLGSGQWFKAHQTLLTRSARRLTKMRGKFLHMVIKLISFYLMITI